MVVRLLLAVFACSFLVAGCAWLPSLPDRELSVVPECPPPPTVQGLRLDCAPAVAAALGTLDPVHPPISRVSFDYGPCLDVIVIPTEGERSASDLMDCAVHMLGTVSIEFVGGAWEPVAIRVEYARGGAVVTAP